MEVFEGREVDGRRIVGDANDAAWEEGSAFLALPFSFEDGCGANEPW